MDTTAEIQDQGDLSSEDIRNNAFAKEALVLMPWLKEMSLYVSKDETEVTYKRLLNIESRLMLNDKLYLDDICNPLWEKMTKDKKWHPHPLHEELEYFRYVTRLINVLSHKVINLTPEEFNEWEEKGRKEMQQ
jgi:hypothetical protein